MQYEDLQIEIPDDQRIILKKMLEKGWTGLCIMDGESDIPIYDVHLGEDGETLFTWHIHNTEVE